MRLIKYRDPENVSKLGLLEGEQIAPLDLSGGQYTTLTDILESENPLATVELLRDANAPKMPLDQVRVEAPIDAHEIWAAGVTYKRSQTARMQESEYAASCYDRVYDAPRPEIFMKATPHRVAGPGEAVRIRQDSTWSVPEPELALVLNSHGALVGFTIGNDMSARDIEGENPLYLPQAKIYDGCCSIGPCITLAEFMPPVDETKIQLRIWRKSACVFEGKTTLDRMHRGYEELSNWLLRDNTFPNGVVMLTGTGVVPPDDFSLKAGDSISISIDGIGELTNSVVQG